MKNSFDKIDDNIISIIKEIDELNIDDTKNKSINFYLDEALQHIIFVKHYIHKEKYEREKEKKK